MSTLLALKLLGAVLSLGALMARIAQRRSTPSVGETSGPPVTGPSLGAQLVGEQCDVCTKGIMIESEGKRCKRCKRAIHLACAKEHKAVHQPMKPPYR